MVQAGIYRVSGYVTPDVGGEGGNAALDQGFIIHRQPVYLVERIGVLPYQVEGHILSHAVAPVKGFSHGAGIPVDRILISVFVLSGLLAAFAGWLLAARTNGATPNLGVGMLFEAFAAVVIGGVRLSGGVGRLSGVLAGVLLIGAIDTAINVMGLPPHNTQVIRAGMVLLAVLLDKATSASRRRLLG